MGSGNPARRRRPAGQGGRASRSAARRRLEAGFDRLFQVSPVALGVSTVADGRIIDVHAAWLELFGYRREGCAGSPKPGTGTPRDPHTE